MKVLLSGAHGKMGRCIEGLVDSSDEIVGRISRKEDLEEFHLKVDVALDFSVPEGTEKLIEWAVKTKTPLVIGTTHLSDEIYEKMSIASRKIKICYSSNFSIGMNVLFSLVEKAAKQLPAIFQSEIIEIHHKYKKDAPSGTAQQLADIISRIRNIDHRVYGRHGISEKGRLDDEIGIHSLRCGNIAGEHQVVFAGENEVLKLSHQAINRDIFARGALLAARWLLQQKSDCGLFSMKDVLNSEIF